MQQRLNWGRPLDLTVSIESPFALEVVITLLSYKFKIPDKGTYDGINNPLSTWKTSKDGTICPHLHNEEHSPTILECLPKPLDLEPFFVN